MLKKALANNGLATDDHTGLCEKLYEKAKEDEDMKNVRKELMEYVIKKVESNEEAVRLNLRKLEVAGFDSAWEGNGFNGVGYGGVFAVLDKLGLAGKRMGASGGAASAILASAGVEKFLVLYQTYQLYYEGWHLANGELQRSGTIATGRLLREALYDTSFTSAVYAEAVREDDAFINAQKNAVIVSLAGKTSENTGFRGFLDREQLVKAGYSSGDASVQGVLGFGTKVPSASSKSSSKDVPVSPDTAEEDDAAHHCGDGGSTAVLLPNATPGFSLLIYHTRDVSITAPTKTSIPELFKQGVDDAIEVLQREDLLLTEERGGMFGKKTQVRAVGVLPCSGASVVSETAFTDKLGYEPKKIRDVNYGFGGDGEPDLKTTCEDAIASSEGAYTSSILPSVC
jgi:hypothetical protein